ncbi:hypothetical protein GCM10022237_25300 [Nocardioides ginsengisoli]
MQGGALFQVLRDVEPRCETLIPTSGSIGVDLSAAGVSGVAPPPAETDLRNRLSPGVAEVVARRANAGEEVTYPAYDGSSGQRADLSFRVVRACRDSNPKPSDP